MKFMAHDNVNVNLKKEQKKKSLLLIISSIHLTYTIVVNTSSTSNTVLDHVEDRFVFVKPHVMVGNSHRLKRHGFGVFEKRIWSPYIFQPINFQQSKIIVYLRYYFHWTMMVVMFTIACCKFIIALHWKIIYLYKTQTINKETNNKIIVPIYLR